METLEAKLKEYGLNPNAEILKVLMTENNISTKEELYSGIELGTVNLDNLKKLSKSGSQKNVIKFWGLKLGGTKKETKEEEPEKPETKRVIDTSVPFLLRENVENAEQTYEIASCCNPIPGDEVMGYLSPQGSIIIHKPGCSNAIRLMSNEGNRIVSVKWAIHKLVSFVARIQMTGIDRIGLMNEITNIISSELKVNMTNININVRDGIFNGTIEVYVHHSKDLNNLILRISNIKGIESVNRVESFKQGEFNGK